MKTAIQTFFEDVVSSASDAESECPPSLKHLLSPMTTLCQCCFICNLYQLVSFQLVIGPFQQVSLVLVSYKT